MASKEDHFLICKKRNLYLSLLRQRYTRCTGPFTGGEAKYSKTGTKECTEEQQKPRQSCWEPTLPNESGSSRPRGYTPRCMPASASRENHRQNLCHQIENLGQGNWSSRREANGFREQRSTCDSTQIIHRVEEVRRVMGEKQQQQQDLGTPGAVLLDITKAYPRVNRPLLCTIHGNLGMSQTVVEVVRGIHEGTHYRVRGRQELSEEWLPCRGRIRDNPHIN